MRTRSFIYVLLVVTAAAFGGQRIKPVTPHDLITRADPFASPRATPVRNPQLKSGLERHQFPTRVAADHFPVSSEFAPVAPTFGPNVLHRVGAGTSVITSQSTRLAPFDTVYEQGFYGPRRHIYTYNGQGNTLQRSTQIKSTSGWDETDRIVCTYTPTGLLEGRTEYNTSYQGGISERDLFAYNSEGLMTSSTREWFDPVTGRVQSGQNGSTVYDQQGNPVYYEWEYWYEGEWTAGSKTETWLSDSLQVYITYDRTSEGWTPVNRRTQRDDPQSQDIDYLTEVWNGSHWVNERHSIFKSIWMFDDFVEASWVWKDKDWVPESRRLFAAGEDRSMVECLTEDWEGKEWKPARKQRYRCDEKGHCVYQTMETWNNGWEIQNTIAFVYGVDGGLQQIDSSWTDGALSRVSERTYDSAGHDLDYRAKWYNGAVTEGWAVTHSYTASGHDAEIISSTWAGGRWEFVNRNVFVYDDGDHIRSLTHDICISGEWERSCRFASWDTTDYPGTYWDLDSYSDNRHDRCFDGFSELTFAYRTEVSAIAQGGGTVPEQSTLRQNYPNPFNPTTTIPFAVSTGARTTLVVYDILGREVARPVDEWKDPGEYKAQFDAAGLASGMYITRFTSGTVTQTKKMILMR